MFDLRGCFLFDIIQCSLAMQNVQVLVELLWIFSCGQLNASLQSDPPPYFCSRVALIIFSGGRMVDFKSLL